MELKFDHVFQLKVTLDGVKPPVWRRIQVPCTYSFWDLHVAIQDAMGWNDSHLHEFRIPLLLTDGILRAGIPTDDDFDDDELLVAGWDLPIAGFFTLMNRKADYVYDFGDYWRHTVVLEQILPRPKDVAYPICLGGRRACPPEDCGGVPGYESFLDAVSDPTHEEHEETLTWVGGAFDPKRFDPDSVRFDDPEERWRRAFSAA